MLCNGIDPLSIAPLDSCRGIRNHLLYETAGLFILKFLAQSYQFRADSKLWGSWPAHRPVKPRQLFRRNLFNNKAGFHTAIDQDQRAGRTQVRILVNLDMLSML